MKATLIGIAGGSCSGKTTLARLLVDRLAHAVLISQDSYYRDLRDQEHGTSSLPNFDQPSALDLPLLESHLRSLRSGISIDRPIYDFQTHRRKMESHRVSPRPVVLVDGTLILAVDTTRELFDFSYFIECSEAVRVARRRERDVAERGRSLESVDRQWRETVGPAHHKYVEPSRRFASEVISQDEFTNSPDSLAHRLIGSWRLSINELEG